MMCDYYNDIFNNIKMIIPSYASFCIAIVSMAVLKCVSSLIYTFFIGPAMTAVDFRSKGKWALVTGSTDGIGKEYARKLASRGCDIILVSRTMEKLKTVASEIENEFKVETKVIQIDFSEGDEIYEKIAKEISGLEIGTLVNNVGIYTEYPEKLTDIPDFENYFTKLINTNVKSVVRMTALVLPEMVKREKGVIINISSVASTFPAPMIALYGASKAFINKFTEGIQDEYRNSGVIIQNVQPGVVATNLTALKEGSLRKPDAKTFVESAFKTVGTTGNTTGYLVHDLEVTIANLLCKIIRTFVVQIVEIYMRNQKNHFLKVKK